MWLSENQKFGVGFLAASFFFFVLGLTLFFDRSCLAMGNMLFLIGITLLMGVQRTMGFFTKKEKYRGTAAFVVGIVLILCRWTIIGFAIELYGVLGLFSDFFGVIVGFVGSIPVVGPYLEGATQSLPV